MSFLDRWRGTSGIIGRFVMWLDVREFRRMTKFTRKVQERQDRLNDQIYYDSLPADHPRKSLNSRRK